MNTDHIISLLPPPEKSNVLLFERQTTDDIMKTILAYHKAWAKDYNGIAQSFWRGNNIDTARALFDFLKRNVKYKVEPGKLQTVKSPTMILLDGLGDCKHYALFIVGVFEALKRLGYPSDVVYRFAAYNNDNVPKHVFAVLKDHGREYWIDPVLKRFNQRYPMPKEYRDFTPDGKEIKPNIGELYAISGVQEDTYLDYLDAIGKINFRKFIQGQKTNLENLGRGFKKVVTGQTKLQQGMRDVSTGIDRGIQQAGKGIADAGKRVFDKGKQIVAAPARNAFLGLMKINFGRLASQMWQKAGYDTNSSNWKRIAEQWQKLGGNPTNLHIAIRQGRDVWNRSHPSQRINGAEYNMGVIPDLYSDYRIGGQYEFVQYDTVGEPMTAATLLTLAAPVLLAMAALLKTMGIQQQKDPQPEGGRGSGGSGSDEGYAVDESFAYSQPPVYDSTPTTFDNNIQSLEPSEERSVIQDFSDSIKTFYADNKKTIWIVAGVGVGLYILRNKRPRRRR